VFSFYRIKEVHEDAEEIRRRSIYVPTPTNAVAADDDTFIAYNRFPRPEQNTEILAHFRRHTGTSHAGSADESMRVKRRGTAPGHLHIPHIGPMGESST
jgi:sodium/hydrogen antiporter